MQSRVLVIGSREKEKEDKNLKIVLSILKSLSRLGTYPGGVARGLARGVGWVRLG